MRLARILAIALVLVACERKSSPSPTEEPSWPFLASPLMHEVTLEVKRGPDEGGIDPDFGGLAEVVERDAKEGHAIAGWDAIDAWLEQRIVDHPGKNLVLLFGSDHDAPEHIDAFRRLVGPQSRVPWTRIVVEQFRADGHWKTSEPLDQSGDDRAIDRYMETGTRADLTALLNAQKQDVYTTWKFGAGDALVDLLATARATNRRIGGCDVNGAIREKKNYDGEALRRFRELHCWFALRDALAKQRGPHRVAMFWGHMHLGRFGFAQLVPLDWELAAVHAAGRREYLDSIDDELEQRGVTLVDPVIVGNNTLVLASRSPRSFERVRDSDPAPGTREGSPVVRIDGRPFSAAGSPQPGPGRHVLWVEIAKRKFVAAFELAANERVDIVTWVIPSVHVTLRVIGPRKP